MVFELYLELYFRPSFSITVGRPQIRTHSAMRNLILKTTPTIIKIQTQK